jgi:hypothetical protein
MSWEVVYSGFTYPESRHEDLDLVFGLLAAHFEESVLGSSSDSLNQCYEMEMWKLQQELLEQCTERRRQRMISWQG